VAAQGGYTVLVYDEVRIRKETPQELDRVRCASSIPRSFVDHTNSLRMRPGTPHWAFHRPPRRGEERGAKTSACTCRCSRALSVEI
jgi:hypothetical protein